ncbi:unnamed protein product [Trichogramma brassicae]|uniref:Uncharacterized protein n=1 Tax=Trichogramma brassicae TaxID=86971 RepID=A0A6H5I323_9HYME|nr:unnamed protein product [Trichogramma brassicae]
MKTSPLLLRKTQAAAAAAFTMGASSHDCQIVALLATEHARGAQQRRGRLRRRRSTIRRRESVARRRSLGIAQPMVHLYTYIYIYIYIQKPSKRLHSFARESQARSSFYTQSAVRLILAVAVMVPLLLLLVRRRIFFSCHQSCATGERRYIFFRDIARYTLKLRVFALVARLCG